MGTYNTLYILDRDGKDKYEFKSIATFSDGSINEYETFDLSDSIPIDFYKFVRYEEENFIDPYNNSEFFKTIGVKNYDEFYDSFTAIIHGTTVHVRDNNGSERIIDSGVNFLKYQTWYIKCTEINSLKKIISPEYESTEYFDNVHDGIAWRLFQVKDMLKYVNKKHRDTFKRLFIDPFVEGKMFFICC